MTDEQLRNDAETLNRLACDLTADMDLQSLVQRVCDAGTSLTHAQFGAFFYNNHTEEGDGYQLYTLSGAPREAFEKFGMPSKTQLFGPTFEGAGPVRIDDVLDDPRYGKHAPQHGMPKGHLPVRSYLAVPVVSRSGEVLGGLFFGHPDVGVFDARAERMALGVAAQAAVAIDNARLLAQARNENEARQRSEAALRESESRYRDLVRLLPAAVYTCDIEGRITFFNDRAAALWGRSPKVGETDERFCGAFKLWRPDGSLLPHAQTPMAVALCTGESFRNQDVVIERPDGSRINVLVNIDPIRDEAGRVIGAINVFQDITRRKQTEQALSQSEHRFWRFMQYLPGLAWIKDADGRYVYANDAAEKAFQTPRDKLYGRRDEEVFPEDVAARFRENDDIALSTGSGVQTVEALEHDDGVIHYSLVNKFPIPGPDGETALVGGMALDITDRRRAEEALRETERRFRLMADAAPVLIWVSDEKKRGIYFNDGWLQFTGRPLERELGEGWLENIHPDDLERAATTCQEAFEHGQPFRMEFRMRRADGAYRWVLDHAVPRFTPDGTLAGYIGSCIDVTDKKHAELELRASEERLRLALEAGRMGTWEWSLETNHVNWSPAVEAIHGLETGTFGGSFDDFQKDIHPEDVERVRSTIERAVETGDDLDMEYRIVLADGEERWVEGRGKLLRDETGKPVRMTGVCSDVTERKNAERARAHLAAIVESTGDAVISKTLDGTITSWNPSAERLYGYTAEEAIGQSITMLIPPEQRDEEQQIFSRLAQGDRIENYETVRVTRDGRHVDVSLTISPVCDSDGRLIGASKVARDITERKRAEESLRQRFDQLQAIYRLSAAAGQATTSQEISESALDALVTGVPADRAAVLLFDDDGVMRFKSWRGLSQEYRDAVEGHSPWSANDADAQPVPVNDVKQDASLAEYMPTLEREGIRSLAFIPVKSADRVLGKFMVYYDEPHEFREEELQLCQTLAGHVGFAVERWHTESALRASEERFRAIVEGQSEMVCRFHLDGTIVFVNGAYARMRGATPEALTGKNFWQFIKEDDRPRVKAMLDLLTPDEPEIRIENQLETVDGVRWTLWTNRALAFDDRGVPTELQSAGIDITDRKRAEALLKAKEAELELVAETTPLILTRCTSDLRYRFVNRSAAALFGLEPDEIVNRPIAEVLGERAFAAVKPHIDEVLQGRLVEFETQIHYPRAGLRWVHANYVPERDAAGNVNGWVASIVDITARKLAEEKLRRSEQELSDFFENASIGLHWVGPDGIIQRVNQAELEMLGFAREEYVGRHIAEFHVDQDAINDILERLKAGETLCEYPAQLRCKDGSIRDVLINSSVLFENGEFIHTRSFTLDITARKEAEAALRESEDRFRMLADNIPQLAWVCDHLGEAVWYNKRWYDYTGANAEQMQGWGWTTVHHPDHVDRVIKRVKEAWDSGEHWKDTFPLRGKDGEYRWFYSQAVPIRDAEGNILRWFGTNTDITEQLEAETALRESEEQFRRAIEDAPIPVIMQAEDGEILQISRAWSALTGYSIDDAPLFQEWLTSAYGTGGKSVEGAIDKLFIDDKGLENVEFEIETRDGNTRQWLLNASTPGMLRDGRRFIVCMAQDITDRKRIEDALRESESRFRDMADYAPVLIFVNGPEGCEFVNREYLHFLGRPFNDVRGAKWLDYVHPDDREECVSTYQRAYDECRPFEIRHRFLRSDGEYRWVQSAGVPRFTRNGDMLGYVGCSVDYTDQVTARKSLEKQSAMLEEAVKQRTAELEASNQRLRLAERMASLGTLSAGLGHDIGNILIPVRVRLEALAGVEKLPADMREHVDVIRQSTEYLQRLASGLRLLAVDPNRAPPNETTLVSEWWIDAEPMFNNALPRSVTLKSKLPNEDCWVAMSRAALTQMVFNLVQNAGEATRDVQGGEVCVCIEATKAHVRMKVSDNGRGMSEEIRRHCMEPFFTTKARAFSTGLGLSLIHRMVQDAKGTIDVASEPGEGTTFTIMLSRAHIDEIEKPASGAKRRLAVVHLSDARLQAFACAELRTLEFDVVLGPSRLHEGELVVIDCDPADITLREGAGVILLGGRDGRNGTQGKRAQALNGNGAPLEEHAGHFVSTEARPKAIRTAIAELVQRYASARSSEQKVARRPAER